MSVSIDMFIFVCVYIYTFMALDRPAANLFVTLGVSFSSFTAKIAKTKMHLVWVHFSLPCFPLNLQNSLQN